jgi:AraC-like DNA-binding protein
MIFTCLLLTAIVVVLLLLNHWHTNKGVAYLVLLICLVSIRLWTVLFLNTKVDPELLSFLIAQFDPFICLTGPVLWYYFQSIIKGKLVADRALLLHLIPAFLVLVNTFPYYFADPYYKLQFVIEYNLDPNHVTHKVSDYLLFMPFKWQQAFIYISNSTYLIFTIVFYVRSRKQGSIYFKQKLKEQLNRFLLISFVSLGLLTFLGPISLFLSIQQQVISFNQSIFQSNGYIFLIALFIPLTLFLYPSWLYGENGSRVSLADYWSRFRSNFNPVPVLAQTSESSSEDVARITEYIIQKQPYLKPNFSLHDISRALNIPHIRVTNCFSKQIKSSFPIYRNNLRIEYAKSLIREGAHLTISIEGIALKSGFKSKVPFYAAFKSETGVTPSEWIKDNYQ